MAPHTLLAVFGSTQAAEAARDALVHAGYDLHDAVVSIDLAADGIAAETPGQAYENQPKADDAFPRSLADAFTPPRVEPDTRQAERMADIERGNAVLTVTGTARQLERASHLLRSLQPLVLRREA
jgi:hypothetical protein